jgi:hypothetical protein
LGRILGLKRERRKMSFFRFLGCFICESEKAGVKEIDKVTVPVQVQYSSIKGEDPYLSSTDSSFDSEAEFITKEKDEKSMVKSVYDIQSVQVAAIATPRPGLNDRQRSNRALIVASKGTYSHVELEFPELEHEREVVIRNHAAGLRRG